MSFGRHWLLYGVQRLVPVALAATLAGAAPVQADEPAVHPIFTTAETVGNGFGWWTGYSATIQVRPLTFVIWPGGFTSDSLFVQNGLMQINGDLYTFAWATHDTSNAQSGAVPLRPRRITPMAGSWITFELVASGGRWTFRYRDATGWHVQGSWLAKTHLNTFFVSSEYWGTTPQSFAPQAVRDVRLRSRGAWRVPTGMFFGPTTDQCGHTQVWSSKPGLLGFRSVEGPCRMYRRLW